MKIASRVLGLILGFAGLVFIAIAVSAKPESVLAARDWRATWSAIAFAVIFLLGAWYFLWLDVDALEDDWDPPPNAFVRFIFLSRRALAALAMFGCVGEF